MQLPPPGQMTFGGLLQLGLSTGGSGPGDPATAHGSVHMSGSLVADLGGVR